MFHVKHTFNNVTRNVRYNDSVCLLCLYIMCTCSKFCFEHVNFTHNIVGNRPTQYNSITIKSMQTTVQCKGDNSLENSISILKI